MSAFACKFWVDGWELPTIEAAIAKAEQIASKPSFKGAAPTTIAFTATGEPAALRPYAVKTTGTWKFASSGYAIGGLS